MLSWRKTPKNCTVCWRALSSNMRPQTWCVICCVILSQKVPRNELVPARRLRPRHPRAACRLCRAPQWPAGTSHWRATGGGRAMRRPRAAADWPPCRDCHPARGMGEGVNAATHPGASWDVCGAEAVPLALAARVREDSAAPRRRWVHTPGGTPLHPRARGGFRTGCHDVVNMERSSPRAVGPAPLAPPRLRPPTHPARGGGCRSCGWCAPLSTWSQRLLLSCPVEPQPAHPVAKECPL